MVAGVASVVAGAVGIVAVVARVAGMLYSCQPNVDVAMLIHRRSGRGGRGGAAGGAGGRKVIVEPHRHKGVFVARGGKEDLLATVNLVPGESVYGEKRISVENATKAENGNTTKTEYRVSVYLSVVGQFRNNTARRCMCHSQNIG